MTTLAPARARQSFRHEAWMWHDAADFTATMVPFITDGFAAGEPVMVGVLPEHAEWLRDALAGQSDPVPFVDIVTAVSNPSQIITTWHEFLDTRPEPSGPARGIGEPIWPGQRPQELEECQLYEAQLNVLIDPDTLLWDEPGALICEVVDNATVGALPNGHRSTSYSHDDLWPTHHVGDLAQRRSSSTGTTVRTSTWKPRAPSGPSWRSGRTEPDREWGG